MRFDKALRKDEYDLTSICLSAFFLKKDYEVVTLNVRDEGACWIMELEVPEGEGKEWLMVFINYIWASEEGI